MQLFYTYTLFTVFTFLYLFLGQTLFSSKNLNYSLYILVGIIFSCITSFFLKVLGFNIYFQLFIPFTLILFYRKRISFNYRKLKGLFHVNFLLWFLVNFKIGLSIFYITKGVTSSWRSNYGDLPFHFSIIHSFTIGDNFLPEYPIFPGQVLSYPFMINHWTSMIWSLNIDYFFLRHIFVFQWVALWSLSYFFLKGNKFWLLPWLVLLGGGSFLANSTNDLSIWSFWLDSNLSIGSYDNLQHSFVPFLSKIWVPQRSSVFGVTTLLGALYVFFSEENKKNIILSGLLLASMALIHAHFALVTSLFLLLYLALKYCFYVRSKENLNFLFILFLSLLSGCIYLPWLLGKSSILSLSFGWLTPKSYDLIDYITNFVLFWFKNAGHLLVLSLVLFFTKKDYKWFVPLLLIFIFGNIFNLSVWKWDQIKIFIPLYIILVFYISTFNSKKAFYLHFLLFFLTFQSIYIIKITFKEKYNFGVYSQRNIEISKVVKMNTPLKAIIANRPVHNSPISLSGRFQYLGYTGHLWSHGIDYSDRIDVVRNFDKLVNCKKDKLLEVCPDYVLFTDGDKKYWKITNDDIKKYSNLVKLDDILYKIN